MYDVPGSGKHHRRPGGAGSHKKYRKPAVSQSDKMWLTGGGVYLVLMLTFGRIADIGVYFMLFFTLVMAGAVMWRMWYHPGDRHFNGVNTTPEEDEEFKRVTGEIPVIEPTAVSHPQPAAQAVPSAPPVSVVVQRPGVPAWMPSVGSMIMLGGALVAKLLSEAEVERAQQSHQQMGRIDAALGIPGAWNNYQPTVPAHGHRGWDPGPDAHHFSGGVKVPWQEP